MPFRQWLHNQKTSKDDTSEEMQQQPPTLAEKHSLARLPDEVVIKVLSYLDYFDLEILSTLHRRLRDLCLRPSLWTHLRIARSQIRRGSWEFQMSPYQLIRRWRFVIKHVSLTEPLTESNSSLATFAIQHCPNLESLTVDCTRTKSIMNAIPSHGHKLRKLCFLNPNFHADMLARLPRDRLANLTSIDLRYVDIGDHHLMFFADNCRSLEEFACGGGGMGKEAINYFLNTLSSSLRRIHFKASMSPAELDSISRLSRLTHLSINLLGKDLSAGNFVRMFGERTLACLTSLHLSCHFYVSTFLHVDRDPVDVRVMEEIAGNCPGLMELVLIGCNNAAMGLARVLEGCRLLQSLYFKVWRGVTKEEEELLADLPTARLKNFYVCYYAPSQSFVLGESWCIDK